MQNSFGGLELKFKYDKKYLAWGITLFLVFAAGSTFVVAISNLSTVRAWFNSILKTVQPVLFGLAIAYLVNPIVNFFEARFKSLFEKKQWKNAGKAARICSVILAFLIVLLIIYTLIAMVLPQLIDSLKGLASNLTVYYQNFDSWLTRLLEEDSTLVSATDEILKKLYEFLASWITNDLLPGLNNYVAQVTSSVFGVFTAFFNAIIGLIISIYLLMSKEKFIAQSKMVTYSIMGVSRANGFIGVIRHAHKVFGGFLTGKILDSLIIGVICFIGMNILNLPYALLISIIVGITNIIPFFGPFLGAIPSAILILVVDPLQCLYFILFIVVLQQIDGNIIGPRILGEATGVSGFWVVVSILVFGGLFGFIGMIVGVPIFAVLYSLISKAVGKSLNKKGIYRQTKDFVTVDYIDPETLEVITFDKVDEKKKK